MKLNRTITMAWLTIAFLSLPFSSMAINEEKGEKTEKKDTVDGASYQLDDLVVVSRKPVVQSDGGKLTYNMQEDLSATGESLSDALRKVPMVSVDGEGKIRINGQENFKILVNGKEDSGLSANYKDIFKAMPATSVVKIEVITEPGAKYDAEGTAGILNLVTITKNTTDGYSGSLTGNFSKERAGMSGYGRVKFGKLTMSANIDYFNARLFHQSNWNETNIENLNSFSDRYQYNSIRQRVKWDYFGGGINLSYDLSAKDLITVNARINTMKGYLISGGKSIFKVWNADHELMGSSIRDLTGSLTETSLSAGAAWQHSFNEKGDKLILSYLFNHNYNFLDGKLKENEATGIPVAPAYQRIYEKRQNNEHTVQLDYEKHIIPDRQVIEAGGKMVIRRNPAYSFTDYNEPQTLLTIQSAPDLSDVSDITQNQDIYALYLSYSGKFGNLASTAGLRFEHTEMGIDYHQGKMQDFTNHLNDLVPNIAFTYSFNPASNLRIVYRMRISRPSLRQINPYKEAIIPNFIETGNPDLTSERANKLTLTYSNYGNRFGGNVGLEYSSIDNAITNFIYTEKEVTYYSFANIGHNRDFAIFGFLNWTPTRKLRISVNARLTRQKYTSKNPDLSNAGWNLNYGGNLNYTLPGEFKLNVYGGQSTKDYGLQQWSDGWYYYGLGVSKDFLRNDALTLTLSAIQFLQPYTSYSTFAKTESIKESFTFHNRNWNVGLSLSWRFGSLKSDVKKAAKQIENDDKSTVSGNGVM